MLLGLLQQEGLTNQGLDRIVLDCLHHQRIYPGSHHFLVAQVSIDILLVGSPRNGFTIYQGDAVGG